MGTKKVEAGSRFNPETSRRVFLKRSAGAIGAASLGAMLPAMGAVAQDPTPVPDPEAVEGTVNWLVSTPALADPAAIGPFTEQTGVEVVAVPYGTQDEMLQKVRGGQAPYDLVNLDQTQVQMLAEEGHILPLDTALLPNLDHVFPVFRDRDTFNFDGQVWGVPQFFGANAIAYNKAKIPVVDSVEALFDPANSGRISMRNSGADSLLVAALKMGLEHPYRMDDAQLAQARDLLIEQKPLVRLYWNGIADLEAAFANDEVDLAWSQLLVVEPLRNAGLDMGWVWPKEGVGAFLAIVALAATSTNPEAAQSLQNYLLGPEWGNAIATAYGYAPTSQLAWDAMSPETLQKVAIDPTRLDTLTFAEPFDREKWNLVWEEVQAA
jgi:spermidine/putrescine transport system substrate-binding protein